jgi:methylthioribose-1-phosphate isomerase
VTPPGITARNPAFDVTPNKYLTGIVTENGVVRPPFTQTLARARNLARAVRGER